MFKYEREAMERFLQSTEFPLDRDQLIERAEQADLPHQLVLLMQRLEERPYSNADEVEHALLAHRA